MVFTLAILSPMTAIELPSVFSPLTPENRALDIPIIFPP
jgi:hypothetical protein